MPDHGFPTLSGLPPTGALAASEQHASSAPIDDVPPEQLERVMRTNVFGYVFMAKVERAGGRRHAVWASA